LLVSLRRLRCLSRKPLVSRACARDCGREVEISQNLLHSLAEIAAIVASHRSRSFPRAPERRLRSGPARRANDGDRARLHRVPQPRRSPASDSSRVFTTTSSSLRRRSVHIKYFCDHAKDRLGGVEASQVSASKQGQAPCAATGVLPIWSRQGRQLPARNLVSRFMRGFRTPCSCR